MKATLIELLDPESYAPCSCGAASKSSDLQKAI